MNEKSDADKTVCPCFTLFPLYTVLVEVRVGGFSTSEAGKLSTRKGEQLLCGRYRELREEVPTFPQLTMP